MSVVNRSYNVLRPLRSASCCWSKYTTCEKLFHFNHGHKTTVKPFLSQISIALQPINRFSIRYAEKCKVSESSSSKTSSPKNYVSSTEFDNKTPSDSGEDELINSETKFKTTNEREEKSQPKFLANHMKITLTDTNLPNDADELHPKKATSLKDILPQTDHPVQDNFKADTGKLIVFRRVVKHLETVEKLFPLFSLSPIHQLIKKKLDIEEKEKLTHLRELKHQSDFKPIMVWKLLVDVLPFGDRQSVSLSSVVLWRLICLTVYTLPPLSVAYLQIYNYLDIYMICGIVVWQTFLNYVLCTMCSHVDKNEKTQIYLAVFPFRIINRHVYFKNTHVKQSKNKFHWGNLRIKGRLALCPKDQFTNLNEYEKMTEKNQVKTMNRKP